MTKKLMMPLMFMMLVSQIKLAIAGAKIIQLSGEVKVRRGVEEAWQPALVGLLLEDIDTILTGVNSEVTLELTDGQIFKLGRNAILDISDLRAITERELFLYLMSQKVHKMEPREGKTRLRIGNVSVVHGESKATSAGKSTDQSEAGYWDYEKNGARALYEQKFYPNSIIKFYKILDRYDKIPDCGEIQFYLGRAFEAIHHIGQALDAYQATVAQNQEQRCQNQEARTWVNDAQQAIERLKK